MGRGIQYIHKMSVYRKMQFLRRIYVRSYNQRVVTCTQVISLHFAVDTSDIGGVCFERTGKREIRKGNRKEKSVEKERQFEIKIKGREEKKKRKEGKKEREV